MLQRLHFATFLISALLLTLAAPSFGQKKDTLKIQAIPHQLKWENEPKAYFIGKSVVTIVAGEKTDMFRDPNVTYNTDNAPKLLFNADPDFVLTASIEHSFTSKWDGGAIVLMQDSLNWVKFCFEKDYTGARRVVSVVTKNISDDCNSVQINSNKVFYKVAKADNVITLYYSINGIKWFLVRHFQFDSTKALQVGFLAQSPTGKTCRVKFQNITYSARKIKDPYLGE
jgi:regulation of enolase protein 1 (concanavalin A-like superfamily)